MNAFYLIATIYCIFSLALTATPDDNGWESKLVSEIEKQEKEVQKMREQQEFSLLRVRLSF